MLCSSGWASVSMNSWNSSAAAGRGALRATPTAFDRATAGSMTNQSIGAPFFLACSGM